MSDCIDCGEQITDGKKGTTICSRCVDFRGSKLSPEQLAAMAKTGIDALVDEVTGYEQVRPRGDLKSRYDNYLEEENGNGFKKQIKHI